MTTRQQPNIVTLQLLCFALCAGMLIFAIIAIVMTIEGKSPGAQRNPAPAPSLALLLLSVAGAVGVAGTIASVAIRLAAIRRARELWRGEGSVEERELALWSRFSAQIISLAAIAESFGMLGILALFLGGPPLGWWGMVAPALALVAIFRVLPTQAKYESFLSRATSEA